MKAFNKKKGFTIVELVIVVAVIGVLTAVLVPTFVNLVNKANEAADESLVKNLNTALRMSENEQGRKNNNLSEAIDDVYDAGYVLENLTPRGSRDIVWNQDKDEFSLRAEAPSSDAYKFWKIYNSYSDINNTYSAFLNQDDYTGAVNVTVGFDCGKNFGVGAITYTKGAAAKDDVRIRSAGPNATLTVNADTDTVTHYGFASVVTIEAVHTASYHEAGTVKELTAKKGHIVVEENAIVMDVKSSEGSTASFDVEQGGVVVHADAGTVEETAIDNDSLNIGTREQLEAFRDATNSGMNFAGKTITLTNNIDLISGWKPISNYSRTLATNPNPNTYEEIDNKAGFFFAGTFDGAGHTISGLTNKGLKLSEVNTGANDSSVQGTEEYTYGLFACVKGATIKNLKLTGVDIRDVRIQNGEKMMVGDHVGALVGFVFEGATIDGVKVEGSVTGYDSVAGIVGGRRTRVIKNGTPTSTAEVVIKNCENKANIAAVRRAAGIVGQLAGVATLNGNVNSGRIASTGEAGSASTGYLVAGGIATINNQANTDIVFSGNTNSGAVSAAVVHGSIAAATVGTAQQGLDSNGHYAKVNSVWSWTPAN